MAGAGLEEFAADLSSETGLVPGEQHEDQKPGLSAVTRDSGDSSEARAAPVKRPMLQKSVNDDRDGQMTD